MKKKILTIIVLILTMPIFAQTDGYFMYEDNNDVKGGTTGTRAGTATYPVGVGNGFGIAGMNEQVTNVPLGSGLLLLTGAGLAYALLKRKEEETK